MNKPSRLNVAAHVGAKSAPTSSPDDLLFKPAAPAPPAPAAQPAEEAMLRFGSQLPANILVQLHRVSYWRRVPIYEVLTEALDLLYATDPDAQKQLPEKERVARKMPHA